MQCKWCKEEIDSDDIPCPYCGHRFRLGCLFAWPVIIIISFLFPPLSLLVGGWLCWCRVTTKKELEERRQETLFKTKASKNMDK